MCLVYKQIALLPFIYKLGCVHAFIPSFPSLVYFLKLSVNLSGEGLLEYCPCHSLSFYSVIPRYN
jgi:hypothetical protein